MPIAWVDVPDPKNPPAGAPKLSAANLARLALIEDAATAGTPTGDALKAAYGLAALVPDPNGTDDTAAIQTALNAGGQIVFRGGRTWKINAGIGLFPVSHSRIVIEKGATLQVIPNSLTTYRLLNIGGNAAVTDVVLEVNGTLRGDLTSHSGDLSAASQYGHLIYVTNGSSNIRVRGAGTITQAWGDGIYIGGGSTQCSDVRVEGLTVTDNRRENIAPFWVSDCEIRGCKVTLAGYTAAQLGLATSPSSGIDCEPNAGQSVDNLRIIDNWVDSSQGSGIYCSQNPGLITQLLIRGNLVTNSGLSTTALTTYQWNGIHVAGPNRPVLIDNIVMSSGYDNDPNGASGGIYLRSTNKAVIRGGYLRANLGRGLFLSQATSSDISNLTIQDSNSMGATVFSSDGTVMENVKFLDNVSVPVAKAHLTWQQTNNGQIRNCTFRGNKGTYWLSIDTAGSDNVILDNVGLLTQSSAMPGSGAYNDSGTGTYARRNVTKSIGGSTTWVNETAPGEYPAYTTAGGAAETLPRLQATSATQTLASQTLRLAYFQSRNNFTATNIASFAGTTAAAATPTLCRMGLYLVNADSSLTLVASCASDTTLWSAVNTMNRRALSASYAISAGQWYAIGLLCVTSATAPTVVGLTLPESALVGSGQSPRLLAQVTAQSDLPASIAAPTSTNDSANLVYGCLT